MSLKSWTRRIPHLVGSFLLFSAFIVACSTGSDRVQQSKASWMNCYHAPLRVETAIECLHDQAGCIADTTFITDRTFYSWVSLKACDSITYMIEHLWVQSLVRSRVLADSGEQLVGRKRTEVEFMPDVLNSRVIQIVVPLRNADSSWRFDTLYHDVDAGTFQE